MINSVKLNDRGQRFVDAEFVLGVEPRSGGVVDAVVRARRVGQGQGPSATRRALTGTRRRLGRPRLALVGDLRRRRRRRSRHRHQRVQRRADGARQQPDREDAGALPRGEAHRDDVESRRAGRGRQGHGRRVDVHEGHGRQLRLPLAQPVSAVLRARRGARPSTASKSLWPSGKKQTVRAADQGESRASRCASRSGASRAPGDARSRPAGDGTGRSRPWRTAAPAGRTAASNRGSGGIEGVGGAVDRAAQIVDVAVDERSAHAGAVDDVELVARAGRDAAGERVLPEDRLDVGAARAVVVHAVPVAGERAPADRGREIRRRPSWRPSRAPGGTRRRPAARRSRRPCSTTLPTNRQFSSVGRGCRAGDRGRSRSSACGCCGRCSRGRAPSPAIWPRCSTETPPPHGLV